MPLPALLAAVLQAAPWIVGGTLAGGAAIGAARRAGQSRNPLDDREDAESIANTPDGAFMGALDTLSGPFEAAMDLGMGNFEGAGRRVLDVAGNVVDAFLPGDLIPSFSRVKDRPSYSDYVGGIEPGVGKFAVDVLGGIGGDPLNLIPGAAIARAAGGVAKGAKAGYAAARPVAARVLGDEAIGLGEQAIGSALSTANRRIHDIFGSRAHLAPRSRELIEEGEKLGEVTNAAQGGRFEELAKSVPDETLRQDAFHVLNNVIPDEAGQYRVLDETAYKLEPTADDLAAMSLPTAPGATGTALTEPRFAAPGEGKLVTPEHTVKDVPDLDKALGVRGVATATSPQLSDPGYILDPMQVYEQAITPARASAAAERAMAAEPDRLVRESRRVFRDSNDLYMGGRGEVMKVAPEGKSQFGEKLTAPEEPRVRYADVDPLTGAPLLPDAAQGTTALPRAAIADVNTIVANLEKRVDAMKLEPARAEQLKAYLRERMPLMQRQYRESVEGGALFRPQGIDLQREMPIDYVQRQYKELLKGVDVTGGAPSFTKGREIATTKPEELAKALNAMKAEGIEPVRDVAKLDLDRAAQQGRSLKSAKIIQGVIGDAASAARQKRAAGQAITELEEKAIAAEGKALAEAGTVGTFQDLLTEMEKQGLKADADHLRQAALGMGKRNSFMELLHKTNRFFKPYAFYGAFIPKFGSNVRNRVGTIWQTVSQLAKDGDLAGAMASPATAGQVKRFASDLNQAFSESLTKQLKYVKPNEMTQMLHDIDAAIKAGTGSAADTVAALRKAGKNDAADVMESGVTVGYVANEELLKKMARTGWKAKFMNAMDWPAEFFQGVEQRARAGLFLDMKRSIQQEKVAAGMSKEAAEAAAKQEARQFTQEALYDYSQTHSWNRAARDIIPFFQFSAKAIPQQAKFLANNPAALSGIKAAMLQGEDEPVYPWMEGKVNIPLGVGDDGNFTYASGLGLPFEALGTIPGSATDARRNILGSAHPLIKSGVSALFGRDVYFDTPFGSYSKLPGGVEAGGLGRAYNVLQGTGMLGPLDSPLRTIGGVADPKKGLGLGVLDAMTGLSVRSVDPDRALAQKLDAELKQRPDVRQLTTLYRESDDPETKEMLAELRRARERIKERKLAALAD